MTTTERCINCDGIGWVGLAMSRVPCPVCDTNGCVPSLGPVPTVRLSINCDFATLNEIGRLTAECSRLRIENDAIQGAFGALLDGQRKAEAERDAARAEAETLRTEMEALKSSECGWFWVGGWAYANLDGRIVRNTNGVWAAEDADHLVYGHTAIEAARAAGWHDFPGVDVEVPS